MKGLMVIEVEYPEIEREVIEFPTLAAARADLAMHLREMRQHGFYDMRRVGPASVRLGCMAEVKTVTVMAAA